MPERKRLLHAHQQTPNLPTCISSATCPWLYRITRPPTYLAASGTSVPSPRYPVSFGGGGGFGSWHCPLRAAVHAGGGGEGAGCHGRQGMVFSVRLGGCFKSCCLPGPGSRATTTTIAALARKVVVVACWPPRRCAREAAVCVCVCLRVPNWSPRYRGCGRSSPGCFAAGTSTSRINPGRVVRF